MEHTKMLQTALKSAVSMGEHDCTLTVQDYTLDRYFETPNELQVKPLKFQIVSAYDRVNKKECPFDAFVKCYKYGWDRQLIDEQKNLQEEIEFAQACSDEKNSTLVWGN